MASKRKRPSKEVDHPPALRVPYVADTKEMDSVLGRFNTIMRAEHEALESYLDTLPFSLAVVGIRERIRRLEEQIKRNCEGLPQLDEIDEGFDLVVHGLKNSEKPVSECCEMMRVLKRQSMRLRNQEFTEQLNYFKKKAASNPGNFCPSPLLLTRVKTERLWKEAGQLLGQRSRWMERFKETYLSKEEYAQKLLEGELMIDELLKPHSLFICPVNNPIRELKNIGADTSCPEGNEIR